MNLDIITTTTIIIIIIIIIIITNHGDVTAVKSETRT